MLEVLAEVFPLITSQFDIRSFHLCTPLRLHALKPSDFDLY
jgi:hypothetical protein